MTETPLEMPAEDAAEQHTEASRREGRRVAVRDEVPLEADPADALDQVDEVPLDEDELR